MTQFTLVCSVLRPSSKGLKELLNSLVAQSNQDYEIVFVVGASHLKDQAILRWLLPNYPQARMILASSQEPLATTTSKLLDDLTSTWIGFIGQRDRLLPTALEAVSTAAAASPDIRVVFTDEESRDSLGRITQRFDKLGLNPMRLRSQEYLRDLTMVNRAWLIELGGYPPALHDCPAHGVYLKTLELLGPAAFVHIPQKLYQRFRQYRDQPADLRKYTHIPGFDVTAIRDHLLRIDILGKVSPRLGTANLQYTLTRTPWVTIYLIADGTYEQARRRVSALIAHSAYAPVYVQVVVTNPDPQVHELISSFGRTFGFKTNHVVDNLAGWLNQEILRTDGNYIALLRGELIHDGWLTELLSHAMLPNAGVVGGKCLTPVQIAQPGVINYRYEGWDWNSRGKYNLLNVAHNTSAVSSSNMLFSVDTFLALEGFDESLPELYGMDFCLRSQALGQSIVMIPGSTVMVSNSSSPPDAETALFKGRWSAWSDQYQQILTW